MLKSLQSEIPIVGPETSTEEKRIRKKLPTSLPVPINDRRIKWIRSALMIAKGLINYIGTLEKILLF